jgi:hypothetical protein
MGATPQQREAFITTYMDNLPEVMRPDEVTRVIDLALANAFHYGWNPKHLAQSVAAGVKDAQNPVGLGIHRLQTLSKRKPVTTPTPATYEPVKRVPQLPKGLRDELFAVLRDVASGRIVGEQGVGLIADIYARFALMPESDLESQNIIE